MNRSFTKVLPAVVVLAFQAACGDAEDAAAPGAQPKPQPTATVGVGSPAPVQSAAAGAATDAGPAAVDAGAPPSEPQTPSDGLASECVTLVATSATAVRVGKISVDTGIVTEGAPVNVASTGMGAYSLTSSIGVVGNNIFACFSYSAATKLWHIDAVTGALSPTSAACAGVTAADDASLWVPAHPNRLLRYDLVPTFTGTHAAELPAPQGPRIGPAGPGAIYAWGVGSTMPSRIDLATGASTPVPLEPVNAGVTGISAASGQRIALATMITNTTSALRVFDAATGKQLAIYPQTKRLLGLSCRATP